MTRTQRVIPHLWFGDQAEEQAPSLGRGALAALGVDGRRPLMVHTSLRRPGPVEDGAEGVIDALLRALTSVGTVVFPLGSEGDEPFDARTSCAERDIGARCHGGCASVHTGQPLAVQSSPAARRPTPATR